MPSSACIFFFLNKRHPPPLPFSLAGIPPPPNVSSTNGPSLYVVRGARKGLDASFACAAHSGEPNRFAALEVDEGRVVRRTVLASRDEVEALMQDDRFRGVHVDTRDDPALRPLTAPEGATPLDVATLRRAKSDDEIAALDALASLTLDKLYRSASDGDATRFRGAAASDGATPPARSFFATRTTPGFVEYRGGFQDDLGRMADLTRVVPRTASGATGSGVEANLRATHAAVGVGVDPDEVQDAFEARLDPERDAVYGRVLHHCGFETVDHVVPHDDVLRKYDYVKLGAAVGPLATQNPQRDCALFFYAMQPVLCRRQRRRGCHAATGWPRRPP